MSAQPTGIVLPRIAGAKRIRSATLRCQLLWNSYGANCSWALLSSAVLQIQNISLSIIFARCLSSNEFGRYALVLSTLSAAVSIASLSMGMTATRCVSFNLSSKDASLERSLALCKSIAVVTGLLAVGVLLCFARQLGAAIGRPELAPALRFGAPYALFMTMNGFQTGALAGFLAFRQTAQINAVQLAISIVLSVLLTRYGLIGAIVALTAISLCTWSHTGLVLHRVLARNYISLDYRRCLVDRRPVTDIALPASIAGVLVSIALWALIAISSMQPNGIAVIGAFAVATNFRLGILFVPVVLQRVLAAYLSRAEYRNNPAAYKSLYRKGVVFSVGLAFSAALTTFALRKPLLGSFGHSHQVDSGFFALLLIAGVVEAYATSVYQVIGTMASLKWQTLVMLIWSPSLVFIAWLCAHRQAGTLGMATALLFAWIAASVAYTVIARMLLANLKSRRTTNDHVCGSICLKPEATPL